MKRRNIFPGGARFPRHYSKFIDDAGARLGLAIVGLIVAFLLFVVFLVLCPT